MYGMQFSFTLRPGSVQLFDFLIKTIRHHDVISRTSKITTAHGNLLYAYSKQTKSTGKNPTQKTPITAHCRQSLKQTAQR